MEIKIRFREKKKVHAEFDGFIVHTDQSKENGGDQSAPAPFDLFLASIGTCAAVFIQSFCEKRGIPIDRMDLVEKVEWNEKTHLVSKISLELHLPKNFPVKYRESVVSAANLCTVKRHLKEPPQVEIVTQVSQA